MVRLDACGEFAGGVGGLGEAEALPLCPLVTPRAAMTSSRTELLLNRDNSLSAVSGLLGLVSTFRQDRKCFELSYFVLPRFRPRLDFKGYRQSDFVVAQRSLLSCQTYLEQVQ